jgi:hypothetical protein
LHRYELGPKKRLTGCAPPPPSTSNAKTPDGISKSSRTETDALWEDLVAKVGANIEELAKEHPAAKHGP